MESYMKLWNECFSDFIEASREKMNIQFWKFRTIFLWNFEVGAVQKSVNFVDLVTSFRMSILYLEVVFTI